MTHSEHPAAKLYHRKVDLQDLGNKLLVFLASPLHKLPTRYQVEGYTLSPIPIPQDLPSGQLGCGGYMPWRAFDSKSSLLQWVTPIAQELRKQLGAPLQFSTPDLRVPSGVDAAELVLSGPMALRLVLDRLPVAPSCPFWQQARLGKFYDIHSDTFQVVGLLPTLRLDLLHPNGMGNLPLPTSRLRPAGSGADAPEKALESL